MKEYRGGTPVRNGVYFNRTSGELIQVHDKDHRLPGGREDRFVRVPGALAAVCGPFAGLAFVFFLPLIGIIGFAGFIAYKAWQGTKFVFGKRQTERQLGGEGGHGGPV